MVSRRPDAPAWAVGVMMSGLFAGAAGGPLLVGLLAAGEHFAAAWSVCAALALAAATTIALTAALRGPHAPKTGTGLRVGEASDEMRRPHAS